MWTLSLSLVTHPLREKAGKKILQQIKKVSHTHTHNPRSNAAEEDKNDDALRSGNVCAMILGIAQVVKSGTGGQAGGRATIKMVDLSHHHRNHPPAPTRAWYSLIVS